MDQNRKPIAVETESSRVRSSFSVLGKMEGPGPSEDPTSPKTYYGGAQEGTEATVSVSHHQHHGGCCQEHAQAKPSGGIPEAATIEEGGFSLHLDNDGSKFVEVTRAIGGRAKELSGEDIAGGLKRTATSLLNDGSSKLVTAFEAAQKVEIKNGWTPFVESVRTRESIIGASVAPVGVIQVIVASFVFAAFGILLFSLRIGPPASAFFLKSANTVHENAIVPLKQNARVVISDAKARLEQAIAERRAAYAASQSSTGATAAAASGDVELATP